MDREVTLYLFFTGSIPESAAEIEKLANLGRANVLKLLNCHSFILLKAIDCNTFRKPICI